MTWRASNPRSGLVSMKWSGVLGAQNAPRSMGCMGRAKSPLLVINRRNGWWLCSGFNTLEEPWPGGSNGGAQAGPLGKRCCSTTHILRSRLSALPCLYYKSPACDCRLHWSVVQQCGHPCRLANSNLIAIILEDLAALRKRLIARGPYRRQTTSIAVPVS